MLSDMQGLVSVIVPAYNIEEYISRCLDCISSQTYENLEIILVDDGSEDGTGKILDSFAERDSRARVIHSDRNYGLWAARNTGQDAATGEFLWFPDGDDYFHRDFVRVLYEAITKDDGYDVAVAGWRHAYDYDGDITSEITPEYEVISKDSYFDLILYNNPDIWNKLYRRSAIEGIRSKPYPRSQSREFNIRASFVIQSAICVHNCMYFWYRQNPGSLTRTKDVEGIYYACWSLMYYDLSLHLPQEWTHVRGKLLSVLYRKMGLWKQYVHRRTEKDEVYKLCRKYEKVTWKLFVMDPGIGLKEKVRSLFILHHPRLVRFLLSLRLGKHLQQQENA